MLLGYQSETPDVATFIGLGYGPLTPPPLGWDFSRATAFAIYDSTISQADADTQAFNAATVSAESNWFPPGGLAPLQWENYPDPIVYEPPIT